MFYHAISPEHVSPGMPLAAANPTEIRSPETSSFGETPRMSWRGTFALLFLASVLVSATSVRAQTTLNFNSLPSAQGWTYTADFNSVPEASIFSVSGGVLHQNSFGTSGANFYDIPGIVDPNLPFSLTMRARVPQEEFVNGDHYGFNVAFGTSSQVYQFGFGSGEIDDPSGATIFTGDLTSYHDYRIDGTFGASGSYNFFMDNVLVATGQPFAENYNYLEFGDGTYGQNASADLTSLSFSQVTPEPSSLLLLAPGLIGLLGYGWRQRQGKPSSPFRGSRS